MIVWILEPPTDLANSRALQLLGSLTVRAFASVESLITVAKIENAVAPDILVVNTQSPRDADIAARLHLAFSEARILVLSRANCSSESVEQFDPEISSSDLLRRIRVPRARAAFADYALDAERSKLTCTSMGASVDLTQKERRLVQLLLQRIDREITREELLNVVWDGVKVAPRTLDSHISRLRSKLSELGIHVSCSYRGGYRLSLSNSTALEA